MSDIVKIENLEKVILEVRGVRVLIDSDVAQIYGVETRDINKAVTNNPDKYPSGYIVELTKTEKLELVENFHRFEKLKHSTVTPIAALEGADALTIVTEWEEFRAPDFPAVKAALRTPVIIDGRNMYEPKDVRAAGLEYFSIGRW